MRSINIHDNRQYACGSQYLDNVHLRCRNMDIFINPDFTDLMKLKQNDVTDTFPKEYIPRKGHHYHIFINNINPGLFNGSLLEYIQWIIKVTDQRVFVHVPKELYGAEDIIKKILKEEPSAIIIATKMEHSFVFYVDDGIGIRSFYKNQATYMRLLWNMSAKVEMMFHNCERRY